ncbi:PA2169 family four-helix-bundle protein [Aequorivita sp. SDUM287046]|uniref:PA2169 family four-helix-bundle protein n=1 Tax=Aequorivita aurantiaca TaxID=3053356 RepID=A0ABT8DKH7_9FLAO|nr:PA2169 family four-helix-bundle protein [Aequorivita aurantiaca]MDN3725412.1 PA2169 family four-helix-bundle protein [Aequorivita aurantiaca]
MKTEISEKVNNLIEKNYDAYKGYRKAAEDAESMNLRSYLIEQAENRKEFAQELARVLLVVDPDFKVATEGSITGSIHRGWIDIKAAVAGKNDEAILKECIRGDKASIAEYEEFLDNNRAVMPQISSTIQQQLAEIRKTLDTVSRLEDIK